MTDIHMPHIRMVLSFDFGTHHIGVAVAQTITGDARGVATLKARSGKPQWHQIAELVDAHQPTHLVVGLPLNMDGSTSEMSTRAEQFAHQLQQRFKLPTKMHDERLTSRVAKELLEGARESGTAKSDHELAACLIAQSWLAEQATKCTPSGN